MFVSLSNSPKQFQINKYDWNKTFTFTNKSGQTVIIKPSQVTWWLNKDTGYVYAKKRRVNVVLHRMLMQNPGNSSVDHRNQDKLDNRRFNLKLVTTSKNLYNKPKTANRQTKYKGVYRRKDRFRVSFRHNYKLYHLGYFNCVKEAARAYDRALKEFYPDAPKTAFNFK